MQGSGTPPIAEPARNPEAKRLAWSLSRDGLANLLAGLGQPAFRSRQVWDWLYRKRAATFGAMANIPAKIRAELEDLLDLSPCQTVSVISDASGTRKSLLEFRDGERVESVLIPSRRGDATICVSSQAGCAFGCAFCATGDCGFRRNLDAGEIVAQYMEASLNSPSPVTHVVFMGMGEPFANYDNVLQAVRIFNDHDGIDIGARRITLSSCGVVPGILRLAGEPIQLELAISLHAPTDALRSSLMPVNRRWPIAELIAACRDFNARTGRIVTMEYTLISGVNDTRACASELAGILSPSFARVNLIPLSPVAHFSGIRPSAEHCNAFAAILRRSGLNVTLRNSMGSSVAAACGQLRATGIQTSGEGI